MTERFQVDLAGMVDLLSRHLYSGPQVYLRELMQNAVDAVTARAAAQVGAPGRIRLRAGIDAEGRATLELTDTGIGLTGDEAAELLATIGRSSKRDPLMGMGRTEFIGQFGIGLLAAFMVAEQIEVRSRSIDPDADPILWIGRADGTFEVSADDDPERPIGTSVRLIARPDAAHWLAPETVLALATDYGSLLPFDVAVEVGEHDGTAALPQGSEDAGEAVLWRRISRPELPWRAPHDSTEERSRALIAYCEDTFGFTPLGYVDLNLPAAGVSGVAYLLPQAVSPGSGQHRVYVKRMLLGQRVDRVMPEWAFFVRAVIDADALSPTASREQLHDDEVLLGVREALGDQLKQWALKTLRTPNALSRSFIETHHLALRALALTDPEMLALVAEVLPYETTDGPMTLADAARGEVSTDDAIDDHTDAPDSAGVREIVYTTTTEAYRRVAAVARAQGLVVVNAGYVYDADLLAQLGTRPGWRVRELSSDDLVQVLRVPGLDREMQLADALAAARAVLQDDDCDVIVRGFSPESVSAILLRDADGERRRDLDRERQAAPDRWGGLLDAFAEKAAPRSRTIVLNDDSALTRRLLAAPDSPVFASGLRAVYLSAVMLAGEGLRAREATALGDALGSLLDASLHTQNPPQEKELP